MISVLKIHLLRLGLLDPRLFFISVLKINLLKCFSCEKYIFFLWGFKILNVGMLDCFCGGFMCTFLWGSQSQPAVLCLKLKIYLVDSLKTGFVKMTDDFHFSTKDSPFKNILFIKWVLRFTVGRAVLFV